MAKRIAALTDRELVERIGVLLPGLVEAWRDGGPHSARAARWIRYVAGSSKPRPILERRDGPKECPAMLRIRTALLELLTADEADALGLAS